MCSIDKVARKKCYAQVLLKQLGLLSATSNNYQQINDTLHNILKQKNKTLYSEPAADDDLWLNLIVNPSDLQNHAN